MDTLSFKTISANKNTVKKEWVVVDATDQALGRLGSKVAKLLRGKYKPSFTPHVDCGDNEPSYIFAYVGSGPGMQANVPWIFPSSSQQTIQ